MPVDNMTLHCRPIVINEIGTSSGQDVLCEWAPGTHSCETGIEGVDCRFQQRCGRGICQGS